MKKAYLRFRFFILLFFICSQGLTMESTPTKLSETPSEILWLLLKQKKTAESRQWRKLLHFESDLFYRNRSQVTDQNFFLSPHGFEDPEDELLATLTGFFQSEENLPRSYNKTNPNTSLIQHPICRYPARLKFLKNELHRHPLWDQLPTPKCDQLNQFIRSLSAESVSFVFSSYYANNPGSAFGHTFFRVNKTASAGVKKQELLDYGVSFAANTQSESPLVYGIYGIAGGFSGSFNYVPYYFKVREYNDFESRDLWSYELNLTEDELDFFILHLWEIGTHSFTYYFFTKNCSSQMLTLLEAAAPRLYLSEKMPFYVLPSDSLKVLFTETNLIKQIDFRPSLKRQFKEKYGKLSSSERAEFLNYVKEKKWSDDFNLLTDERKSMIVDAFLDFADLNDPLGVLKKQGEWYQLKQENLLKRSELKFISAESSYKTPENERPDNSHPSSRLGFGAGVSKVDQQSAAYFDLRFALHDLMDNNAGLPAFSELDFFHLKLFFETQNLHLEKFSLFKATQLNPLSEIEKKISWSLELGWKRFNFCQDSFACLGVGFKSSFGLSSIQNFSETQNILFWVMPLLEYKYSDAFENTPSYYAYGSNIGFLYSFNQKHKFLYSHEKEFFNHHRILETNFFEYRLNWAKSKSVSLTSDQMVWAVNLFYFF